MGRILMGGLVMGAFASIAAIVFELGVSQHNAPQLALATVTIVLSWAVIHTTFALHYAHDYYHGASPGGFAVSQAATGKTTPTIGISCIFPS